MSEPLHVRGGMTVRQLKDWLRDRPEADENGDEYEVWVATGAGLSSPCEAAYKLNAGDVILEPSEAAWDRLGLPDTGTEGT